MGVSVGADKRSDAHVIACDFVRHVGEDAETRDDLKRLCLRRPHARNNSGTARRMASAREMPPRHKMHHQASMAAKEHRDEIEPACGKPRWRA